MLLKSKTILLAGITGGLGRIAAATIAEHGGSVIAIGRNENRMKEVLESLAGTGHQCFHCDLLDVGSIPTKIKEIGIQMDGAAYLAGIDETRPLAVLSEESMERIFRINVFSAAMVCKAMQLQGVAAKAGASVVLVSSVMGIVGSPGRCVYSASKAALMGLARSASLECARRRIRINTVMPGYINTPMTEKQQALLTPEQLDRIRSMHPLGLGSPIDVANAVMFLLSDLSSWITGTSIIVDGGYSAA